MRLTTSFVAVLSATLIAGCSRPEAPAELHWRFAGGNALRAQTNAPQLAEALRIPQAAAASAPLAARLTEVMWHVGSGGKPLAAAELASGSGWVSDLLRLPSVGEITLLPKGGHGIAVGVQGLGEGTAAWEKNWTTFARALQTARGGGEPAILRQEGWVFAVSDATALPVAAAAKRLGAYRAEPGTLVQFDARYPGSVTLKAAMTASGGFALWTGSITTAKPLMPASRMGTWEIPGAIREPLSQFTAIRGLRALADSLPWIKSWAGKSVPSQYFIWGQPGLPEGGHTYFAARVEDPKSTLAELNQRIAPLFPPANPSKFRGQLDYDEKLGRLTIKGSLPVIPMFEAQKQGDLGYLTFGFVPMRHSTNALAPELLKQLNRPNLTYYDWEFTGEATRHWHLIGQIHGLFEGRHAVQNTPGAQWLFAATPKLGETVTEALVTGPNTLSLQRKSSLGLTGLELAALAKWIDPEPPFRRVLPAGTNAPVRKK